MQDGERLVRWLTFQEVDRPPYYQIWLGWDMTHDRWQRESGLRTLNERAFFNLDSGFERVPVAMHVFPPFEREIVENLGDSYIERDDRGILMRQRRDKGCSYRCQEATAVVDCSGRRSSEKTSLAT